jgi:predicted MFS family arabinose efflux permease
MEYEYISSYDVSAGGEPSICDQDDIDDEELIQESNKSPKRKISSRNVAYVEHGAGLSNWLVAIIAVATGLTAANVYYVQPLLHDIAVEFKTTTAAAGMLVTATQFGFAVGILLLLPLGDLVERKRMIILLLILSSAVLAVSGVSPSLGPLEMIAIAIGTTSVVAQVLVSFVATVSTVQNRGAMVGRTMSGLLLGIVLARTASGALAQVAGWRSVYWIAAIAMLAMALLLGSVLPRLRPQLDIGYRRLLHSVVVIFREEPVLRRRSLYGAVSFAAFSVLWTNLAFLLSGAPYHYNTMEIGLFGLAGATGAACASIAGKLTDKGHARISSVTFFSSTTLAFALLALGRASLVPLLAGIILLDLGVWGTHVSNQSLIYRLRHHAEGRITAIYMTSYFVGGTVGSAASALLYAKEGWLADCALGAAFGLIAIIFWLTEIRRLGDYYSRLTPVKK